MPLKKSLPILIITLFLNHLLLNAQELPSPEGLTAPSLVLIDSCNERILFTRNEETVYPPASLTKLITLYLALDFMRNGGPDFEDLFIIDETGSSFSRPVGSSLMLLEEGQSVAWIDLLRGLAIASGNDAAYAVAKIVGGDPEKFVELMNHFSQKHGFTFYFKDPDGWSAENRVTPLGMAFFAQKYIKDYPEALELLHKMVWFEYPKQSNWQPGHYYRITETRKKRNTNLLLGIVSGVDGLKTGYIEESGFHFIATAKRGRTRLIAVVMGIQEKDYARGLELRAQEAAVLLEYGFSNFITSRIVIPSDIKIPLRYGRKKALSIGLQGEPEITLKAEEMETAIAIIEIDNKKGAPVFIEDRLGSLLLWNRWKPVIIPVMAQETVDKREFF